MAIDRLQAGGLRAALVLGGARSGKSAFAQRLAERSSERRVYVATGFAGDDEMRERIARHRAERGAGWTTAEVRTELAAFIGATAAPATVLLVDCVTFWLTNLMMADADIAAAIDALAHAAARAKGPLVFVTNEVGMGLVPETPMGRAFRDWQGRANQSLAAACDAAVFVAAGLPMQLKP